LKAIED
jgi:hypothetical protein